jgi:hypothetical protein
MINWGGAIKLRKRKSFLKIKSKNSFPLVKGAKWEYNKIKVGYYDSNSNKIIIIAFIKTSRV